MKKLIILCLVLAMCTTASATLTYVISVTPDGGDKAVWDGTSSVKPSDVITVDWMESGTHPGIAGLIVTVDLGDYEADSLVWQSGQGGFAAAAAGDGHTISGQVLQFPNTAAVNPILTWAFHVPKVDDSTWIHIDITQGFYGGVDKAGNIAEIHVTPEPMTIMLLGLGGLFLRRRIA